jgi:DnaD/phage-associated family protein
MNDRLLLLSPKLAADIGLNEAIILQQLHYWIDKKKHVIEGKSWVYNTYEDWQKQFPFWSVTTITRALKSLEKQGLVQTGNFNTLAFDKTKWYTICYDAIGQFDESVEPERPDDAAALNGPIPEKNEQKTSTAISFLSERARFEQSLGKEKVEEAIGIAAAKGIAAWAYIRKILLNWENDGHRAKREVRKEKLPDWFGKPDVEEKLDDDFIRKRDELRNMLAERDKK